MIEAIIGFVGVIVGSVIAIAKDFVMAWLKRRRNASYSAIRLICILEEYADRCVDVVYDDGTAYGRPAGRYDSGEEYCLPQTDTPAALEFPDDIAWRSIPEALMHRVLAQPNNARGIDRNIAAAGGHSSPPDHGEFFQMRQLGYAELGLRALEITDDLRKRFRVSVESQINLNTDWDPKVFLREKIRSIREGGA